MEESHERFFDDGTGLFSSKLKNYLKIQNNEVFYPSYPQVKDFIKKFIKINYLQHCHLK